MDIFLGYYYYSDYCYHFVKKIMYLQRKKKPYFHVNSFPLPFLCDPTWTSPPLTVNHHHPFRSAPPSSFPFFSFSFPLLPASVLATVSVRSAYLQAATVRRYCCFNQATSGQRATAQWTRKDRRVFSSRSDHLKSPESPFSRLNRFELPDCHAPLLESGELRPQLRYHFEATSLYFNIPKSILNYL